MFDYVALVGKLIIYVIFSFMVCVINYVIGAYLCSLWTG